MGQHIKRIKRDIPKKRNTKPPRVPVEPKEEQEFGKASPEIIMCSECTIVYYHKGWHHNLRSLKNHHEKEVEFKLCPACEMTKRGMFEGEVMVKNMPALKKDELLSLVRNIGSRAYERDPLDRVVRVEVTPRSIRILTSENQLAVSIANQIVRATKAHKGKVSWSKKESIARATISF